MRDPEFAGGDYHDSGRRPSVGLAVARMMAHITYLSEESLRAEVRPQRAQDGDAPTLRLDFEVESYLDHQGANFLDRFDANTYLYLTRVMDYFDPFAEDDARSSALRGNATRVPRCARFDTDWRFPTAHSQMIGRDAPAGGVRRRNQEVSSPWGHDCFLLPVPEYLDLIDTFLSDQDPRR